MECNPTRYINARGSISPIPWVAPLSIKVSCFKSISYNHGVPERTARYRKGPRLQSQPLGRPRPRPRNPFDIQRYINADLVPNLQRSRGTRPKFRSSSLINLLSSSLRNGGSQRFRHNSPRGNLNHKAPIALGWRIPARSDCYNLRGKRWHNICSAWREYNSCSAHRNAARA